MDDSGLPAKSAAGRGPGRRLGSSKSRIESRWVYRLYRSIFGAEDMHSHYRWNAIAPFIAVDTKHSLEVGGGDGRISFEVADAGHSGRITITEFDPRTVAEAEQIAAAGRYTQIDVSQKDLHQLGRERTYDQVLAIDVLEHISDHEHALAEIADVLAANGRLVVSVPTPNYPTVFGRRFHERLGHVRDGYWLEDLEVLLEAAGLRVVAHRYYTGVWVSRAAHLFYGSRVPYVIGVLWAPLFRPMLLRSETTVARDRASSLALVAIKTPGRTT